jgi:hypothetical protein
LLVTGHCQQAKEVARFFMAKRSRAFLIFLNCLSNGFDSSYRL